MSYIGRSPQIGAYSKLDAITTDGSASYTMQLDSANFVPESVNHLIVSVNGVIQAPTDSFTVSGSTITFASSLSVSDTIDFIMALGNVLDIGTPSDSTVSLSKLTATGTKDSTTFLRGDNTFAVPTSNDNTPYFYGRKSSDQSLSRNTQTTITGFTTGELDSDSAFDGTTFTVPSGEAGLYYFHVNLFCNYEPAGNDGEKSIVNFSLNGSNYGEAHLLKHINYDARKHTLGYSVVANMSVGNTMEVKSTLQDGNASGNATILSTLSHFMGFKLIG